jgi:glutathione S-transferase
MTEAPILYSFRRCPYAMRARMAIGSSGVQVALREVVLREKPPEMLAVSPKATVPVLVLSQGDVIDESLDIMRWALGINDPEHWLSHIDEALISQNDGPFKAALDRYKYPHRYGFDDAEPYRLAGWQFLSILNMRLMDQSYLAGETPGFTDIAIFPFVRQFAATDQIWFNAQAAHPLQHWLTGLTTSPLFVQVMQRFAKWQAGDAELLFL